MVANIAQPDVCLVRGDVIGMARGGSTDASEPPAPEDFLFRESIAPIQAPDINHVQRREEELQRLHSVDLPPDS